MPIRFFEENIKSNLKDKRRLAAFIKNLITAEKGIAKLNLTYVFCDDNYLLEKNIQFLHHHTLTDIITFDLSENDKELFAEIYISITRVQENAEKFEVNFTNELHRVIFHGALHLCGYKDKNEAQQKQMRKMENKYLQLYFTDIEN